MGEKIGQQSDVPDVRLLRDQPLPQGAFPGDAAQTFRVYFAPKVHEDICKHAVENSTIEICGVLVGKWERDAHGPFVAITASIRGEAANNRTAEVTFTHETWTRINQQMDTKYRDLAVVGWYHTHPNFGIFLSERDLFIHEHFFSGPGQVALVMDPIRKSEGVFHWSEGKAVLCPNYWIGGWIQARPIEDARGGGGRADSEFTGGGEAAKGQAAHLNRAGPSMLTWAVVACIIVAAFLLGHLMAERQVALEAFSSLARAVIYKNSKLGLSENLSGVDQELDAVNQLTAKLQATPQGKNSAAVATDWNELNLRLATLQQAIRDIRQQYGLTQEETRAMQLFYQSELDAGRTDSGTAQSQPAEPDTATEPPTSQPSPIRRDR